MENPNAPHKIAILLKAKVHEVRPDGLCEVPAVLTKQEIYVIEGSNKQEVVDKLNVLMEKMKEWTR